MEPFDCLVVGSGVNGLVCAAMLGKKGYRVGVLERNDVPGGCIRTGEITLPGFVHDVLSGFHPLFVTSPAYAALGEDLRARGLVYENRAFPTGVLMSDGRWLVMEMDRAANVRRFDACAAGDGAALAAALDGVAAEAPLTFALLGRDLWTASTAGTLAKAGLKLGPAGLAQYFGDALVTARDWLESDFASDEARALLAPWVLHTGLGPDQAASGFMAKVIAFSLEAAGMPVVAGGGFRLVEAFTRLIQDQGGQVICNAEVARVQVKNGRAAGVILADGREVAAAKAVFCSVTPQALYTKLLPPAAVPQPVRRGAERFRFGRADMQIHLALDRPVAWPADDLARTAMVHLSDGIDQVANAVTAANAGLLPAEPTIVVGQPTTQDPSRVPPGKGLLWLQLQELPRQLRGDAAGAIDVRGGWTPEVAERYADRVLARLERFLPGLGGTVLKRTVLSPADLEALNVNLVGGDPYAGDCALDQSFLWRPLKQTKNHRTPIANLFHIGASTHPGPGLAGVSGFIAAGYL
jgi:phytoene dehydrogenase-like protein